MCQKLSVTRLVLDIIGELLESTSTMDRLRTVALAQSSHQAKRRIEEKGVHCLACERFIDRCSSLKK